MKKITGEWEMKHSESQDKIKDAPEEEGNFQEWKKELNKELMIFWKAVMQHHQK